MYTGSVGTSGEEISDKIYQEVVFPLNSLKLYWGGESPGNLSCNFPYVNWSWTRHELTNGMWMQGIYITMGHDSKKVYMYTYIYIFFNGLPFMAAQSLGIAKLSEHRGQVAEFPHG